MDYKYEYGRYKKKVEDQEKEIQRLKERAEGWEQALAANDAIIAAVVESVGTVTVKKEAINRALKENTKVLAHYDEKTDEYTLEIMKEEVGE